MPQSAGVLGETIPPEPLVALVLKVPLVPLMTGLGDGPGVAGLLVPEFDDAVSEEVPRDPEAPVLEPAAPVV